MSARSARKKMPANIQLANYLTTSALSLALTIVLFYFLFVTGDGKTLTKNAWRVLFGFMLVSWHWSVHQAWFGFRWYLNMIGDPQTQWFFDNSYFLSGSYLTGWTGALITTTALLRGNFVKRLSLKLALLIGFWLLIWQLGAMIPEHMDQWWRLFF